jgi:hypothetical protein
VTDEQSVNAAAQRTVSQVRGSLRRYAFIFTALGFLFTAANVLDQMYIRSYERATLLSRDPGLISAENVLARNSNGGRDYKVELKKNDDFKTSLIILMNYYESTAEMIDHWAILGPIVRSSLTCPLGKHARIFLLGQSKPNYWSTDGAFFSPNQFPRTMSMYKKIESSSEEECDGDWRG